MSVRTLFDLGGRIALVTGGSRGLGLQVAAALGEMGAKVALTARKGDELEAARTQLGREGVEALPIPCDLSRPEAVEPMVDTVLAKYGQIDILVNNAGATWGAPTEDHPLEAWQKLLNLNLTAAFLACQAVGKKSMIPRRYGRIVNMASIAGLRGQPAGQAAHHRVQHHQGRARQFHARAGRRVGPVRHHGERDRAGVLSVEDDPRLARADRRPGDCRDAAASPRRRRGPERARGAARFGCVATHHGTDRRGGWRGKRRLKKA